MLNQNLEFEMKNIRVFIGRELVCFASVVDSVKSIDILNAISKPIDRLASVREITEPKASAIGPDLWEMYVDRFCTMHEVTRSALLSQSRQGRLPRLRDLLCDSWIQVTHEKVTHTARRMKMDHSSLHAMSNRLARLEIKNKDLRKLHFDTIEMCGTIIKQITA
jgi:hypothetical protein